MNEQQAINAREEKSRRIYENFLEDLGIVKKYFEDKSITDIKIIGTGEIIVEKFAVGKVFTGEFLEPAQVKGIILSASHLLEREIDYSTGLPKLECVLPKPYNLRFTGILPPAVPNAEIAMRRPANRIFTLEDYKNNGQLQPEEYDLICQYIKDRKNILVGGSTGSGKTTFTNAILKKMTEYTPNDSFYIVEDVPELQCPAHDKTFIEVNRNCAAEAVRTALRWTPNRIIFGEVRYGEVADELIKSWNTGHTGNVTTIHADTAGSMLLRLQDILAEVIKGVLPDLTQVIHLCVHLKKRPGMAPLVDEVLPVKEGTKSFLNMLRDNNLG
jgi:type IV secretion system protein TrbB